VLDKGVEGVLANTAAYNERQGNARRAAFFRQFLDIQRSGVA
jgi:hypothetical protein